MRKNEIALLALVFAGVLSSQTIHGDNAAKDPIKSKPPVPVATTTSAPSALTPTPGASYGVPSDLETGLSAEMADKIDEIPSSTYPLESIVLPNGKHIKSRPKAEKK
jgi:hypothetical protein